MTDHQIRVGILGAGLAGNIHVRALKQLPDLEISGVAASNQQSAARFAKQHGVLLAYDRWETLVEDPSVDVIHVCLPNTLHFQACLKALLAGKHVLCDKPLGVSSTEAKSLADKAKEKNLVHGLCSNYRCLPVIKMAKAWIEAGKIGKPLYARGHYLQSYNLKPLTQPWKADGSMIGPSYVTADLGHHWLDLFLHLTGQKLKQVRGHFESLGHCPSNVENHAWVHLQTESGLRAQALFSKVAAGHHNSLVIEIGGTRGLIRWDQTRQDDLIFQSAEGITEVHTRGLASEHDLVGLPPKHHGGWVDGFINLFHNYYQAVRRSGASKSYPDFVDGYRLNRLIDLLIQSNQENRVVDCEL
ncbi:MAG: Gfo/Idh/MocA family oxidoreductase [Bdellovibrionota bacterium]